MINRFANTLGIAWPTTGDWVAAALAAALLVLVWLAAIRELEEDGLEETPCPSNFPQELENREFNYAFLNHSEGTESAQGRWASGPSMDGKGEITYVEQPPALGPVQELGQIDPRLFGTPKVPVPASDRGLMFQDEKA